MTAASPRSRTARGLAAAMTLAALAVGCSSEADAPEPSAPSPTAEVVEAGALVLCTESPYLPFVGREDGEEGDYTGFEIDLMRGMAAQLDLDLKIRDAPYATLSDGSVLSGDQCDVAGGALAVTEERGAVMDFLVPHFEVSLTLLVPSASDVDGVGDLARRRLAVQQDSQAQSYAELAVPEAELVPLAGDQYMFAALRQGRVDAVLQELPLNLAHTRDDRFSIVDSLPTGEQYAFAVAADDDPLRRSLDRALRTLRRDGTFQELYDEYFAPGER